ncbi:hypothetical protein [Maribacter sp. ACAM166]|jgi:hypothetical protein|uniref:hypothetical protein n=1 Tax=Maribacter sp. ACAM166 TaxID=2508996 RepID=UPI0010FD0808|nr:hypothetical protein [Maribacter sp. ACAM166]TLP74367.1 hypothetical protein ES765_15980 [Maribacter sp. ACAM166]
MSSNLDSQVQRNTKGKQLEKDGKILEAMVLYEANIYENFEGSFPYRRLAILYRKKKLWAEEIRVLEKAVFVFDSLIPTERNDVQPKLQDFIMALSKAQVKIPKFK